MSRFPILYWPRSTKSDSDYQTARKVINAEIGAMPDVITGELNVACDNLWHCANGRIYNFARGLICGIGLRAAWPIKNLKSTHC